MGGPLRGIPDTLSVLAAWLRDAGACGLYGTGAWQLGWLLLFRRAGRVYVALDRDATDRAIALARTFGTRGRVLILGLKGDLNDWLPVGGKGRSRRVSIRTGAGARDEPDALGASDSAVTAGSGALGYRGPCRCARPPM
jgi:hypothetical protein